MLIYQDTFNTTINTSEMKTGDIGIITTNCEYSQQILMRVGDLYYLFNSCDYWSKDPKFQVKLFKSGTKLILEV